MNLTANKGEWSELYALFKIFAEHKIVAADNELQPTGHYFNFLKIFRNDNPDMPLEYNLEHDGQVIIMGTKGDIIKSIDVSDLPPKTKKIFKRIKGASASAFSIPEAETLMGDFLLTKIKAKSKDKSDMVATINDNITSETKPYGFSIKSQIGSASTLLNASGGTNFVYKIKNLSANINDINAINTKSKVRDRLQAIIAHGGLIEFVKPISKTFQTNLQTIDTMFPKIIADMLLNYYLGNGCNMINSCEIIGYDKPFGLNNNQIADKVKNFLKVIALGMVPQTEWDIKLSTYGYIVVRNDGMLLCYHIYNEDLFKDYLFNNTKFDTPSSTRHKFGTIYKQNNDLFINLNLQIRFLK